jgi:hypothetical protein
MMKLKHGLACLAAFGMVILATSGVFAADKTGVAADPISELEERIADLEAKAARKGNTKVKVTITGSVNQALIFWDENLTGKADARVGSNATTDTYVTFKVEARLTKDVKAGAVLEIGQGAFNLLLDQAAVNTSTDIYTRRQAVFVESPLGTVTLGKDSQATDGVVDGTTVANTAPAARMLSFRPLLGGDGITENLDLFDGQRLNVVRYDTPDFGGFIASASWSRDGTGLATDVTDVWDAALTYSGTFDAFRAAAAVGYRKGAVFPGLDPLLPLPQVAIDQETVSGSVSLMHLTTGLFLNAAAGQAKFGDDKVTAWEVMPGIEQRLNRLGKTTFFGEYAVIKIDGLGDDLTYYGGGIVQAVDGAAMSIYVSGRHVELEGLGGDAFTYGTAGVKIDF